MTLEVEIVRYKPGSRTMRLAVGFGAGAVRLAYKATVLDASGNLLGHTEGKKGYMGFDPDHAFKSDREVRLVVLDDCAGQISEYVQSLPIAGADQFSVGP